jgi:hypothetical protein
MRVRVLGADPTLAIDHHRNRHADQRSKRVLHVVTAEALEHRVVHFEFDDERLELFAESSTEIRRPAARSGRTSAETPRNQGISTLQGPHHVAQKSIMITFPLKRRQPHVLAVRVLEVKSRFAAFAIGRARDRRFLGL